MGIVTSIDALGTLQQRVDKFLNAVEIFQSREYLWRFFKALDVT
ncbi:MAG: hypothetical protein QW085_07310 [Pyrobaculum sp.]